MSTSERRNVIQAALICMEGGSLQRELHKAGLPISTSAFIQRRHKIPAFLFEDILSAFNALLAFHGDFVPCGKSGLSYYLQEEIYFSPFSNICAKSPKMLVKDLSMCLLRKS